MRNMKMSSVLFKKNKANIYNREEIYQNRFQSNKGKPTC